MISKSLNIPIYGNRLHIAVVEDFMQDVEQLNKDFSNDFTEEDNVLGMTQQRGGHTLIIINVGKHKKLFKKNYELELFSTISHEALHATNTIFKNKGIRLDMDNDEPQAYFLGWLVKEVYKAYLAHKKQQLCG